MGIPGGSEGLNSPLVKGGLPRGCALTFLTGVALVLGCFFYLLFTSFPPKESTFVENFQTHRAEFEQLHDMLQTDSQIVRLGSWGVATQSTLSPQFPPAGDFPLARFQQYRSLCEQAGVRVIDVERKPSSTIYFGTWGWGWAGYTRHAGICWMDGTPTNQIFSIDGYRHKSGHPQIAYKPIAPGWYVWTDL